MISNIELIEKFYSSFKNLDSDGMAECYHENIQFSDPVFPGLKGDRAKTMWKMLCSQAQEFELTFHSLKAEGNTGQASWEARYRFSKTGRLVHNKITAVFTFENGKIITHKDSFSFWKWSVMALGLLGLVLGWSPLVKNKVRAQARKSLENYIKSGS